MPLHPAIKMLCCHFLMKKNGDTFKCICRLTGLAIYDFIMAEV